MRLVGYVRVSRVAGREGASFISPGDQRRAIEASGHDIVEVIEDLDQPGTKADRPGLVRAMGLVESGQAEGIVVAKLDRFGRSVIDTAKNVEAIRAADGVLVSAAEGIDTRTPMGRFFLTLLSAFAELEIERIRAGWASARSRASERGAWLSEAPVGYRKGPGGGLEVDDSGPRITEAFKRRLSGDSWKVIAGWLTGEGVPSKRGGEWTVSAIRRLIANRVYLGGPHEPLTSPAIFEAANAAKGVAPGRSGRASGLLSGLLRCSGCRYAMKLSMSRTRHGKPFTEYRCKASRGEAAGKCEAPAAIKSSVIEPVVMEAFWDAIGFQRGRGVPADELVTEAEGRVMQAEAELDASLDTRLVEALGGESPVYIEAVRRRREAVDSARANLADAMRRAHSATLPDVDLRTLWPDLSLYERRKLLALAFDAVFVRRGSKMPRHFVCIHGTAPELPVRGVKWTPRPFDFPPAPESGA